MAARAGHGAAAPCAHPPPLIFERRFDMASNPIQQGTSAQPLTSLGLDPFEEGLLFVARHLMAGLQDGCPNAPLRAQKVATERWGEAIGLSAAHYLSNLLTSLIDCRDDDPDFRDPFALELRATVTDDEALLLTALHHMRRDQTPKARETVMLLSGGFMDPHLIRAGLSFAARFPAGTATPRKRTPAPRLQLVS